MSGKELQTWARNNWSNMITYAVYNNPQAVREWIDEVSSLPPSAMSEDQMIQFVFTQARNSANPWQFVKKFALAIPHQDIQTNWANIKRGA
jgi:hypothetical protein